MTPTPNDFLRDPLFQLNAVLWLAQPLPEASTVAPLLHRQGFGVYAIAPLLGPPADVRLAAQTVGIAIQERVRPDVVLSRERDRRFSLVECKASSFEVTSPTAEQARSLLIAAGPRGAEMLGLAPREVSDSLLTFVSREHECEELAQTVSALSLELARSELPAGRSSCLGLTMTAHEVAVEVNAAASDFLGLPVGRNRFIDCEEGSDPRPLYFIPYDPDVTQSPQEAVFCKRVLFERIQSEVIAAVGRSNPPAEVVLESGKLLNSAMFGMYGHWENQDSASHMRRLCRQLMDAITQAANSVSQDAIAFQPGRGWTVNLASEEQHESVLDALTRFSCETLSLRVEPSPSLFDGLEADSTDYTR